MSKIKNTEIITEKIVAQNKWTTIIEEKFNTDNGKVGEYLIVDRMPALMIIPIIYQDGNVYTYLVKQYRHPIKKEVWQFPMGTLEGDADPKFHAIKELRDETGLVTQELNLVGSYFIDPGLSRQKCFVYITDQISEIGKQNLEETESGLESKKFSLNELESLIAENQLIDGWVYPGYYFLKQFLRENKAN